MWSTGSIGQTVTWINELVPTIDKSYQVDFQPGVKKVNSSLIHH